LLNQTKPVRRGEVMRKTIKEKRTMGRSVKQRKACSDDFEHANDGREGDATAKEKIIGKRKESGHSVRTPLLRRRTTSPG